MRRFAVACALPAVGLLSIVVVLYVQDARHEQAILQGEGAHIATLASEFCAHELRAVQSDLRYLAEQVSLRRFLAGVDGARAELEQEYASFARNKKIYDQVRFLDTSGQEVVRVNYGDGAVTVVPPDQLQAKATRYYYTAAMALAVGEVFVSPFDLNIEHGHIERPIKPTIRFLTPVADAGGQTRGLVVLNYLGAHLLAKLKDICSGFRGETLLLNAAGEYLQGPRPEDDWGWMLGHDRGFHRDFPDAWARLRGRSSGHLQIDGSLFALERIVPRALLSESSAVPPAPDDDPATLLLLSYLDKSVLQARPKNLLRQLLLMYGVAMLLVVVLSLYWARSSAIREHQEHRLAQSETRLRLLSSRLLAAQEEERRNLSRTLHDELGQLVTAISLDLKSAAREPYGGQTAILLRRAIDETNQLLTNLHQIATRVRPSVLDDLGLHDAVESYLSEYQQRTGITVHCDMAFDSQQIPPVVGENAYRILQEALTNVASHAGAAEAMVVIRVGADRLRMVIEDQGAGFDLQAAEAGSRLGILGMRERVELLHGEFDLDTRPGRGTRIGVTLPLAYN